MSRIIVVGGGWSGVSAAISAIKAGAEVVLIEKTDLLLGAGNVGGIFRNNGRYTAAEQTRRSDPVPESGHHIIVDEEGNQR